MNIVGVPLTAWAIQWSRRVPFSSMKNNARAHSPLPSSKTP
jgi:hypothetical protein